MTYKFNTAYNYEGDIYGSYLFARDMDHAYELTVMRNIGEDQWTLNPSSGPSKPEMKKPSELFQIQPFQKRDNLYHQIMFLSWIGIKSGRMNLDEVLSDQGVLHELHHWYTLNQCDRVSDERMIEILKEFEEKVSEFWNY